MGAFNQYANQGFSIIHNWMANFILRKKFPGYVDEFLPTITHMTVPMDQRAYVNDNFARVLGILSFFLFNSYLVPLYRLTYRIVNEKETRARESMKMMGLTDTSYWLSWFSYYMCVVTLISSVVTQIVGGLIKTQKSVFFVTVWLFGMSLFGYALVFQSLFNKARTAAGLTLTVYFIMSFFDSLVREPETPRSERTLMSLISTCALSRMMDFMSNAEKNVGVNWTNMHTEFQNYVYADGLKMMLVSSLFLMSLGLYLDNVVQQQFGTAKPYNYFMTKSYWGYDISKVKAAVGDPQSEMKDLENNIDAEDHFIKDKRNYEPVTNQELLQQVKEQKILQVCQLRKNFGDFHAVQGINLRMYNGQIFALLGHNGAGKTTTISMLTGLIPPSMGRAQIFNKNLFGQMDSVRKFMGVCPQHDVLFDLLTPAEHLEIFCTFKGVSKKERRDQIEQVLKDIDLDQYRDIQAGSLSGGNRRKLSVAIALVGDSKFILLDEPTAGMDLSSRRKMWDMLKKYKSNRIIILTTHYMDEADILGDRIGIMTNGTVTCLGRSMFLKNRFGVGYRLSMVKKEKDTNTLIKPFLEQQLGEDIKKLSEISSEIIFQIPKHMSEKFKGFFKTFDKKLDSLGIKSYGISVTTLEEVFLRVGHGIIEEDDVKQAIDDKAKTIGHDKEQSDRDLPEPDSTPEVDDYVTQYTIENQDSSYNYCEQLAAIIRRRWQVYRRTPTALFFEIVGPVVLVTIGLAFSQVEFLRQSTPKSLNEIQWDQQIYCNSKLLGSFWPAMDIPPMTICDNLPEGLKVKELANKQNFGRDMFEYSADLYDNRLGEAPYRQGSYFILGANNYSKVFQLATFINASSQDSSAFYPNYLYEATLRTATGNPDFIFNVTNSPYPLSQRLKNRGASSNAILICLVAGIGFALIPASTVGNIVSEKELGLKHMQVVSGLSLMSYWLANLIFDLLKTILPCILVVIVIQLFDMEYNNSWATILLFPFGVVPYSYALSFAFTKESTAQTVILFSNIVAGSIGGMAVFILRLIPDTMATGDSMAGLLKVFPTYTISNSIIYDGSKDVYNSSRELAMEADEDLNKTVKNMTLEGWDIENVGGDVRALQQHFIFGLILVILIEVGAFKFIGKLSKPSLRKTADFQEPDNDVIDEERRVDRLDPKNCLVRVNQLKKVYSGSCSTAPVTAVENCTFSVDKGECFALLGVNGAGKSTCFKSLTAGIDPSQGKVTVKGYDVEKSFGKARQFIGYCPQHDTIFDALTVIQHLEFISVIKRIPKYLNGQPLREPMCERAIISLNLGEYRDKQAGTLSGGNKRKLSVAMALLGSPPVVLLDEPSAGMDPEARRFMWNIISEVSQKKKQSGVVITTHSMEEAEALSTKMGILVKGGVFKCFGSSQHVKNKFGTGYEIEVKFKLLTETQISSVAKWLGLTGDKTTLPIFQKTITNMNIDQFVLNELEWYGSGNDLYQDQQAYGYIQVSQAIQWLHTEICGLSFIKHLTKEFYQVEVLEHVSDFYKLKVPRGNTTIGYTFGKIESCKPKYHISEYSVSQTTLEQIFQAFAKVKIGATTDKSIFSLTQTGEIVLNKQISHALKFYVDMEIADYKFFEQYRSSNILGTRDVTRQESQVSQRRSRSHLQDQEELKQEKPPVSKKKNLRFESTDWNEEEMLQHVVKDKMDQKIGGMYKKEERKIKRAIVAQAQNSAQSQSQVPLIGSREGSRAGSRGFETRSALQNAGQLMIEGPKISPE